MSYLCLHTTEPWQMSKSNRDRGMEARVLGILYKTFIHGLRSFSAMRCGYCNSLKILIH